MQTLKAGEGDLDTRHSSSEASLKSQTNPLYAAAPPNAKDSFTSAHSVTTNVSVDVPEETQFIEANAGPIKVSSKLEQVDGSNALTPPAKTYSASTGSAKETHTKLNSTSTELYPPRIANTSPITSDDVPTASVKSETTPLNTAVPLNAKESLTSAHSLPTNMSIDVPEETPFIEAYAAAIKVSSKSEQVAGGNTSIPPGKPYSASTGSVAQEIHPKSDSTSTELSPPSIANASPITSDDVATGRMGDDTLTLMSEQHSQDKQDDQPGIALEEPMEDVICSSDLAPDENIPDCSTNGDSNSVQSFIPDCCGLLKKKKKKPKRARSNRNDGDKNLSDFDDDEATIEIVAADYRKQIVTPVNGKFECPLNCGISLPSPGILSNHLYRVHGDTDCPFCDAQSFSTLDLLIDHRDKAAWCPTDGCNLRVCASSPFEYGYQALNFHLWCAHGIKKCPRCVCKFGDIDTFHWHKCCEEDKCVKPTPKPKSVTYDLGMTQSAISDFELLRRIEAEDLAAYEYAQREAKRRSEERKLAEMRRAEEAMAKFQNIASGHGIIVDTSGPRAVEPGPAMGPYAVTQTTSDELLKATQLNLKNKNTVKVFVTIPCCDCSETLKFSIAIDKRTNHKLNLPSELQCEHCNNITHLCFN